MLRWGHQERSFAIRVRYTTKNNRFAQLLAVGASLRPPRSSNSETPIQRSFQLAAKHLQLFLATAARAVRGVPGPHVPSVFQSSAVMMAQDRRPVSPLGPVAAGGIAARRREPTGRIRAGQDIVHIHRIPAPAYGLTLLAQGRLFRDVDGVRM